MAAHVLHIRDRELELSQTNLHWPYGRPPSATRRPQYGKMSAHLQVCALEDQAVVAFETIEQAQTFEQYLKSGSGHAFAKRHFLESSSKPKSKRIARNSTNAQREAS